MFQYISPKGIGEKAGHLHHPLEFRNVGHFPPHPANKQRR